MDTATLTFDTSRSRLTDLTPDVRSFCAGKGDGLLNVFVPHATAGLAVMELNDGSEPDLLDALERLLPRDDRYTHSHGSKGHGADHLLPAIVSPSLVLPIADGLPELGTWQYVVLVDLNRDNPQRRVVLSFVAG